MAFLQRIVNAGGEIIREMAVGNGRIDMLVKFGNQEFALELKVKPSLWLACKPQVIFLLQKKLKNRKISHIILNGW